MTTSSKSISKKAGLPPGTLIHIGRQKADEIKISVIDYDSSEITESNYSKPEECYPFKDKKSVSWINIDGLHDTDVISEIGKNFDLHPLLLEDVLNTNHRPKLQEFDNYIFLTLKMLGINRTGNSIVSEQVSFVLGDTWLISFQEQEGDIFDGLRTRIQDNNAVARKKGPDYLLYRLIDTIVDNYFFITEHFSDSTERLEEKVLQSADSSTLQELQNLKKLMINFRKSVIPLREAISMLQKDNNTLIRRDTLKYLRDVYEHIIQLIDSIDTQRDLLASILDLYHSIMSNKMNQVMQVLTIIATIFIPLTFIAGVYGMNFSNMPELEWKYGYFGVWILMIAIMVALIYFFRRKKWL